MPRVVVGGVAGRQVYASRIVREAPEMLNIAPASRNSLFVQIGNLHTAGEQRRCDTGGAPAHTGNRDCTRSLQTRERYEMKRVLVVDDEPDVRALITTRLRRQGYEVEAAQDGVAALERLHSELYDLIVLDIRMPRVSGKELLSLIAAESNGSEPKVLVVTAFPAEDLSSAAGHICAIVPKPFQIEDLVEIVDACLEG